MRGLLGVRGFPPYMAVIVLNAAVDLGHKIVVQNTVFKCYDGSLQVALTAIVNALILLPFVLLVTPSGHVSDKFRKNRVLRAAAWIAVLLTLAITACYYLGWFWPAFAMTFLLAAQSAFYSPAKYGYIRELVGTNKLTTANGVVQAATTVAILLGVFLFSVAFERRLAGMDIDQTGPMLQAIAPIGWWLVALSLAEALLCQRLPDAATASADMRFDWERYWRSDYLRETMSSVYRHRTIFLAILGLAIFWALSQVVLAVFPAYAKDALGEYNTVVIQGTLACAGIGVVLGSVIAGRLSRNHIETGLIPIGAFGIALGLLLLPLLGGRVLHAANFAALGLLGGLFIIPLNALIQYHAGEHERGRVLAANNLVQNVMMLAFLAVTVLVAWAGAGQELLFAALFLVALGGAIYTIYELPQALARLIVSGVIARRYRLEVLGFEHLPERGGVLMLGNHVSWIDWAVLQVACPRPIRFVMERGIYERWYLKRILDVFDVVPISSGSSKDALEAVTAAINAGEIVALFPEGTISRTGHLGEFRRGYEKAAAGASGVIIPFYLRGLWGTWFSRSSERLRVLRRDGVKHDVIVAFGAPLPMNTPADRLKRRIFDLSVESWRRYTSTLPTVPAAWLATVKRMNGDMAVADTLTGPMSARRFGAGVLCFARVLKREETGRNVGVLLPTGAGGAIVNVAALVCGKTVVNLNYTASRDALAASLRKAEIRVVYTSARFLRRLEQRGVDIAPALENVRVIDVEEQAAAISWAARIAAATALTLLPVSLLRLLYCRRAHVDSPAAILFSSGSEGEPKGVVLSHRNFMANVKQISDVLNTQDGDVVMATLPLFHAFGLTVTTLMPLLEGIPMVCHADPTDALGVAKAVAAYRGTILCGTSTFLRLYARHKRVHPLMLESLRIIVAGAEKLSADVRDAFALRFNKTILEGYGATETTPVASVNIPDQLDTTHWRVQLGNKPGTVGMPLPGTSFRIVDPDSLAELPAGQDGLILIGGTQVMLGYLDDPARTAAAIVELDGSRWYKTGDKGHLDADGFLTIVDRYSRFAKLGGEMVSLTAVEDRVRETLADRDLDVVAVNLPDAKKGERIVVLAAAALDADSLRKSLLDAGVNPLMVPSLVVQVPAVPKLGSGKTDFNGAKALARELLAADPEAAAGGAL